ncbi:MAG: glycosyltransferase family 2 protein [Chloroflexi bacterium]|nr:glycosyltransferase family 2 protein [Chloroflexota bacterium]
MAPSVPTVEAVATMAPSRVGAIVLNWNGLADTLECLASLADVGYSGLHVFVVDNGSREDPTAVIQARFPRVRCIRSVVNLGLSGGNNLGIRAALDSGCRHVLLLNNDIIVAPDFVAPLVDACETNPAVGIAGALIMHYARPDVIQVGGISILDRSALRLPLRRARVVLEHEDERDLGQLGATHEIAAVSGCAMLIKLAVINAIGGQDRRFYSYFQDIEFCLRAAKHGFRTVMVPGARIWHKGGRDTAAAWGRNSGRQQYWYMRDYQLFMRDQAGLGRYLYQWALGTVRGVLDNRHRRGFVAGSVAGLLSGVLNRASVSLED